MIRIPVTYSTAPEKLTEQLLVLKLERTGAARRMPTAP
jgi:hypothetical protein